MACCHTLPSPTPTRRELLYMNTFLLFLSIVSITVVVVLLGILALDAFFVTDLDAPAGIRRGQDETPETFCRRCGHELDPKDTTHNVSQT